MDGNRFDTITRALTGATSRRGALGGLLGGGVAALAGAIFAGDLAEAKKGGNGKGKGKGKGKAKGRGKRKNGENGKQGQGQQKVVICHKGKTIEVAEPAVDAHVRNHGDTVGPCPGPNPCAGLNEGDPCTLEDGTGTGACCGGVCTRLGTVQNCRDCGDVCQPETDTCSGLGSGGDPESGCCARIGTVCDPSAPDRCCNQSTCTGTNQSGQDVCCGVSNVSGCSIGSNCCSGVCDPISLICA